MTDALIPRTTGTAHHRNNLDFLRLFLAVLVIFSHAWPLTGGALSQDFLGRFTRGRLDFGDEAVEWFFVISGMLVAQSWVRTDSFWRFLKKRSLRIFPGYVVAVGICITCFAPMVGGFRSNCVQLLKCGIKFEPLFSGNLLQKNPFPYFLNGSLWTIRYEFCCYVLLAGFGLFGFLRRPVWSVIGAGLSLLLVVGDHYSVRLPLPAILDRLGNLDSWSRFLPAFMAGVTLHFYRSRLPLRWWIFAIAIALELAVYRFGFVPAGRMVGFAVSAYGVAYLGFHPRIPLHHFGRFGDFSYGTYLYAFAVQQLLVALIPWAIGPWMLFLITTPLSVAAGGISWHLIERPSLRLRLKLA